MAVSISLKSVASAAGKAIGVAYKAALLYLAFEFVSTTVQFYGFVVQTAEAFYALNFRV